MALINHRWAVVEHILRKFDKIRKLEDSEWSLLVESLSEDPAVSVLHAVVERLATASKGSMPWRKFCKRICQSYPKNLDKQKNGITSLQFGEQICATFH